MFKTPDPSTLANQLKTAIRTNQSPSKLLYSFMQSRTIAGNYVSNAIIENKVVLRIITSPEGRTWVKRNIDSFLDYLAVLGK